MFGGGGCVPADGVPMPGGCLRAEPAADLLLSFRWSCVPFSLIVRGGYRGVGQEPQDVGLAVPEAFQQEPAGGLLLVRAGDAADLGHPGVHAVPVQLEVLGGAVCGDGVQALAAARASAAGRSPAS